MTGITGSKLYISNEQSKYEMNCAFCCLLEEAIRMTLWHERYYRRWEISLTLTDDEGIRLLNKQFRGTDSATDVLSFPQYTFTGEDRPVGWRRAVLGDIVINTERCAKQAKELGHSFEHEAAFLCVHSVLHLLGYDHEISVEDEEKMCAVQRDVIRSLGYAAPRRTLS